MAPILMHFLILNKESPNHRDSIVKSNSGKPNTRRGGTSI